MRSARLPLPALAPLAALTLAGLAGCAQPSTPPVTPPPAELVQAQQTAQSRLAGYQKAEGKVTIPIERSMALIAEQGIEYGDTLTSPKEAKAAPSAAAAAPAGDAPGPFAVDAAKAEQGKALFTSKTCSACHSVDGSKLVGPSLKGFWGRAVVLADGKSLWADAAYFTESVKAPTAKISGGYPPAMPPLPVSDAEIDLLLHYVASLK